MFRLTLAGVGRLKIGPERDLASRYLERASVAGRTVGVAVDAREIDESSSRRPVDRRRNEANALSALLSAEASIVLLDERGRNLASSDFAALIRAARDDGHATELAIIIGGADGFDDDYRRRADHVLAFGAMTWPHQLVRVMAAEQIYRAITILAGHPYHRG